ncbi:hypothetical protein BH10BAC5_BH10BAC5_06860 [soil metagenome]
MNDSVSVIVLTHNLEKYIQATLDSLCQQTYKNFEVVIIDDGSTDTTLAKVYEFKDRLNLNVIEKVNSGNVGRNRNEAVKAAKGRYIYFLDGDDLWEEGKLEYIHNIFKNSECKIICTNAKVIDSYGNLIKDKYFREITFSPEIKLYDLVRLNFVITSSTGIKKEVISDEVKFEQEEGYLGEDYILWLKIIEKYSGLFINESPVRYRVHESNASLTKPEIRIFLLNKSIRIRSGYFGYPDLEVQKNAKLGCNALFAELSLIYFRQKNYFEAYKNLKRMSFIPGEIKLKSFLKYAPLLCLLFIINIFRH